MSTLDANTTTDFYEFTPTQDWFSSNKSTWQNLFHLVLSNAPRALEIGSWEGRSAVFLLTTLCATGGELVCIDHFDLMGTAEGKERYRKLTHNLALTGRPARVLSQFSVPALYTLLQEETNKDHEAGFDWIYIDGSHRSDDTLLDAELAWRLARPGCIFIFDDYNWPEQPFDSLHHPRRGIDAFLAVHKEEYERLSTNPGQYQMILQKKTPMRIGFLLESNRGSQPYDDLEYGINIALTVDSAYAAAAAVTLHSIVEHVQGRITLYIIDCGLLADDKTKIEASLPARSTVTLLYIALPPNSLTSTMGAVWAKVDMMTCLPVQRVIYLDADVLVRRDLKELWNTDLGGRPLAAAPDVGCPMGHPGVPRGEYFNAGVLLVDLARFRSTLDRLEVCCREMSLSKFHEQDALNIHFKANWVTLSLEWNAQGLGTYAESADKEKLRLKEMEDPAIVHFTGPVHPPVEVVLNPYVQPYTAKPWGYAGAPGHPYGREWWNMCEKTAWKGWKKMTDYKEMCEKAKMEALKKVKDEFNRRLELNVEA